MSFSLLLLLFLCIFCLKRKTWCLLCQLAVVSSHCVAVWCHQCAHSQRGGVDVGHRMSMSGDDTVVLSTPQSGSTCHPSGLVGSERVRAGARRAEGRPPDTTSASTERTVDRRLGIQQPHIQRQGRYCVLGRGRRRTHGHSRWRHRLPQWLRWG